MWEIDKLIMNWIPTTTLFFSLLKSDKISLLHAICHYREEYVRPTTTLFTKVYKYMAGCTTESSAAYNTNRGIDL